MDDEQKKVVKKKVVKKVVKKPVEEGGTTEGDDALAAFGITETKDVSKAKMVTPVAKPVTAAVQPGPPPVAQGTPHKVVPKKVVKKVTKRPVEAPVAKAKPAVVEAAVEEGEGDGIEVEPVVESDPALAATVTAPPTAKPHDAMAEEAKGGGVKDCSPTATAKAQGTGPAGETKDADLDRANQMLDSIDLDDITKNIQEDLLETFENKIDDILVDIIEDEDSVEELTKTDSGKTAAKPPQRSDDDLDAFLAEERTPAKPVAPAKTATVTKPVAPPKPTPTKTEVTPRPVVKLDADVERPKKAAPADEPVTMEKTEVKILADEPTPPRKDETKAEPESASSSEPLRIEDGDVRERRVAYKVASNFNKLPPNMRNELLRNLAKVGDPKVREDVVCAIATHFKNLPPDVQALMTNLARDDDIRVREEVVFEIQKNFANISAQVRERILKAMVLDKEPTVREEVISAICEHYVELSADVRDQLRALAKDKVRSVRENLSFEMQKSDSPVPKEVRDELLGILKGTR